MPAPGHTENTNHLHSIEYLCDDPVEILKSGGYAAALLKHQFWNYGASPMRHLLKVS